MADYGTVVGFVQFDPINRDYNGENLTDVTLRSVSTGKLIRATIWPEFQVEVEKGDFVAADGKISTNRYKAKDGTEKTSTNLSVTNLVVLSPCVKEATSLVTSKETVTSKAGV